MQIGGCRAMNTTIISKLDFVGLDFEKLPKGDFFQLAVNPYNGKVFMKLGKNEYSSACAYSVLKDLVRVCMSFERQGCHDPLQKVSTLTLREIETLSSEKGRRAEVKVVHFGMKRKAV